MVKFIAIYALWLREMKRFVRARSRLLGSIITPFFFLAFLGMGFGGINIGLNISYIQFLVPGIVGMTMVFSSIFSGVSVLWDREFGFLKEVMVAPVDRVSIVVGRILGGASTSLVQGLIILFVSTLLGFKIPGIFELIITIAFMVLISFTFIGLGLIIASRIKDFQGFQLMMNLIMFPILFLSGFLFPIKNLPQWIGVFSYLDPLTYGIDGIRGVLAGISEFNIYFNLTFMLASSIFMILLGAYSFNKSEAV